MCLLTFIVNEWSFHHSKAGGKICCNPNLRFVTKARAGKGAGQQWNSRVTFHAPGSVGKCERMNPTLPNELPFWELDFEWTPKFSEGDCKGQNSLD